MKFANKLTVQIFCIIAISALFAFSFNTLRPEGLPLVFADESIITFEEPGGYISIKDAALLFLSKRAIFIDARSQEEFKQGHIKDALSLPVENFAIFYDDIKGKIEDRELIITYCDGEKCPLSEDLAHELIDTGLTNVQVLKNGWTLWNREGLPIEKFTDGDK